MTEMRANTRQNALESENGRETAFVDLNVQLQAAGHCVSSYHVALVFESRLYECGLHLRKQIV